MNEIKKLEGIGGWLILFSIGLFVGLGINIQELLTDYGLNTSSDPVLEKIIVFEDIGVAIGLIFLIIVIINFFQKKRKVINLIKYYYIYIISYSILDGIIVSSYFNMVNAVVIVPIIQAIISAAIWISYFQRSVRVKNTFIND